MEAIKPNHDRVLGVFVVNLLSLLLEELAKSKT